ncbi:MAG: hypothetical protein GX661_04760, partial [Acholeplasmataceae bacterium]|nr:hypothetical protein [Acholeplasmataceae bacterium]
TLYAKWLNDQDIVDLAYEMLTLTGIDNLTNSSPRLILPIKAANYEKVEITWSIDKTQYISTAGVITQPEHEVGDQTVTLTATLKLNQAQKIKTFTATVKALPPLSETVPLLDEDFKNYPDGEVGSSLGDWALVSGKAGTSVYTVVSSIENVTIPGGSKALKLQAFSERQFEMAIPHNYDVVVIEADLMQTASSEATSINIQSSASSPIVGFGLNGDEIYWRVNNGSQHGVPIELNKFYRVRFEIDLVNKTVQLFYYEDGQLMPITSEPKSYTGDLALTSIFLRTGSSNTTSIRPPAYVSNILINRIEALPRPAESVKLGEIQDLPATQNIAVGSTFIPSVPKVLNYYGSKRDLVKDTDYTLAISGEVNTAVAGNYNVVYTFTNKNNSEDVKTITQVVTVYSEEQPNEISSVETSFVPYPNRKTDITVTVVQPEGVLYYLFSNNETETAEAIKAGISVNITSGTVEIDDAEVGENAYIHIIVVLNGDSNIKSEALDRQLLVEIDTPQKFYYAVHASESEQKKSYYLLIADLDFTDFTWGDQEKSFKTVFDGNGHTISNLTITKEKIGGIFALAEDAIIKNLIIDNVQMSSSKQGALLVGETRGEVRIENIVILNSSYAYETAGSDKVGYAALIVGRIRGGSTTIVNVAISDSDVSNIHKYSAAIVAGTESGITLVMEDIYIQNVDVIEDSGSSECVGVLIGRLKGTADINRVVAVDVFLQAYKNLGGLIGKYETATAPLSISNVFIQGEVECTYSESLTVNAVIGSNAGEPTLSNVWVSGFANSRTSGLSVPEEFKVVFDTVKADAWWTEKMPEIANSDLWAANQQHIQALSNFLATEKPYFAITLVYNLEIEDEVIQVQQGKSLVHTPASMPGYNFVGWFTDEELIEALPENYRISAAVTLYGKYEPAPASTVSFVTNVEGVTIPSQQINYGNKATAPASQQAMVGEVKIEITGWTLNGERFDFNTPITESIELVAVWTTVKYTVKFDGGNSVQVEYGQTVTAPATPTKFFEEYVFTAWLLDGTPFDFETPITADINLVSLFTVSGPIQIDTVEEFIHLVTNEYSDDFILMNDLDFATYEWKQSDKGKAFKGSFDGQNHTLSNITITSEGSSNDVYGGIFQRVDGATIKNLKINNANINNSQGRAGILAGRIENNST